MTTLKTSNLYAGVATVKNTINFNIHDNPELIEEKGNKREGLANWGIEKTSSLEVKPTQKMWRKG